MSHTYQPSQTLLAILRHVKDAESGFSWKELSVALKPVYGFELKLFDLVKVTVCAYREAVAEPRFQLNPFDDGSTLILSPVIGPFSVDVLGPSSMYVSYTVEQFYESILKHMMGELRNTTVNWCSEYLD